MMPLAYDTKLVQTMSGQKTDYVSYKHRLRSAVVGKRWTLYINGVVAGFIRYDLKSRENVNAEWESPAWLVRPLYEDSYRETISKDQAVTEILYVFESWVDNDWPDEVE